MSVQQSMILSIIESGTQLATCRSSSGQLSYRLTPLSTNSQHLYATLGECKAESFVSKEMTRKVKGSRCMVDSLRLISICLVFPTEAPLRMHGTEFTLGVGLSYSFPLHPVP